MSAVVVVEDRSFQVSLHRQTSETMTLAVLADDGRAWRFDVRGWRPWSCGAYNGYFYLWTARQLILFPGSGLEVSQIDVDEDLLFVFKRDFGWIFVCETSVRFSSGDSELSRIEFGEVLAGAIWEGDLLIISDSSGVRSSISVSGEGLLAEHDAQNEKSAD